MADNFSSLEKVSTGYSVFERDQVLTHDQLNRVTEYLDDQGRLTRVELLGVGILGGLHVALRPGNRVSISKGVGVTTDGDLLMLAADTVFEHWKPYDESAPKYPPFYSEDGMRQVFELLVLREDDVRAQPITGMPDTLAGMVVVMLMESYKKDPDLCSGTGCDNLGCDVVNTCRFLLVSEDHARDLLSSPSTASSAARNLLELAAHRPQISGAIENADKLADCYRAACKKIHANLTLNLAKLYGNLSGIVDGLFDGDPGPNWVARLNQSNDEFARRNFGIQYYYGFLKDLVDTWNALREALFEDDSVLCPGLGAFPKHLLLGRLADPAQWRTGFYPSPRGGASRAHARFLVRKLHALINTFNVPTSNELPIRVTPSRSEAASLEERAIPYYYEVKDVSPIHRNWNFRLSRRGAESGNLGYRAEEYGGTDVAQNPLAVQIGRYDFFRVEGHLGQDVQKAKKQIEDTVRQRNLPFVVRAVLLHHDPGGIIVKPPIRYGDLHRLHYLLRNEVATHLGDSGKFNDSFKAGIDRALENTDFPKELAKTLAENAGTRYRGVKDAIQGALPAMASKSYADLRSDTTWKAAYKDVVTATSNFKREMGEIVRTDVATPFDSVAISNHPAWLEWLDTLIQAEEDRADDKLLFPNFIAAHPGFEHSGGVAPGGTFVLVYDDQGHVVADGALPYYWPETAQDQPDEPDLQPPVFRPLQLIENSVKLAPPVDELFKIKLADFRGRIEPVWNAKLDQQQEHLKFMKDSLAVFSDVLTRRSPAQPETPARFGDDLLGLAIDQVQTKADQIDKTRTILSRPDLDEDQRQKALLQLQTMQVDLAKSIVSATTYISTAKVDVATGADGGKALAIIAGTADKVSDGGARDQMQKGLKDVRDHATDAQQAAVGNLLQSIGFRQ